ncbi:DUF417 family protein [Pseudoalteromonas sp. SSM20]|uniref:DUF417 family protein n=1 Tax=Pseudoalteromonas sp. SSM20 TaxID=3139394 RepID=UPI003BAA3B57
MKFISEKQLSFSLLALSSLLMAISTLLLGKDTSIERVIGFYFFDNVSNANNGSVLAACTFLLVAALAFFSLRDEKYERFLVYVLLLTSVVPLITLFASNRWIESLGGFPAIGSGQGVIKYFALLAIAIHLLAKDVLTLPQQKIVQLFPVVLVLLWIGGMKFTEIEAKGIEDLVSSSPFMGWMYQIWSLQTTSNIIGVYDFVALTLLILSLRFRALLLPGLVMAGAVMITTQTFLFTWQGALSSETVLTSGGQFLIKDLWFIANLTLYYGLSKQAN